MIVKRAAVLGRCMGVRRAVELAFRTAEKEEASRVAGAGPRRVYTLGPLIHNPRTVAELEARGIFSIREAVGIHAEGRADVGLDAGGFVLDKPGADGARLELGNAVVVIRAHGVPPALRARLEAEGAEVVDATCPRVLASQRRAEAYARKGWTVVIAGDRDHGEVAGIAGFAPGSIIVGGAGEAEGIEAAGPIALIAQTTIKEEEYRAIREVLEKRAATKTGEGARLEIVDSICPATEERLAALAELAGACGTSDAREACEAREACDALVVVGGRNSANTTRLLATALSLGLPSWLVEGPEELPPEVFSYSRVGVTAGASTPDEAIAEVEAALLSGPRGGGAS